ncbi:MAG: NUDIX hydrolase [Methanothrix sp.]|nr:NUDIX hydrolase [Methanothrix sp.]
MNRKVIIDTKNRIFDDFFRIDESRLSYEKFDGSMSPCVRRLSFERGDSVAALVFNRDTRKVLLVNQFKYPTLEKGPGWITEVVAGSLGPDEDPEVAVRREVFEEIGYRIETIEPIARFYVSPGGTSERIWAYYAEVVNKGKEGSGGGSPDENEDIQTVEISLDELDACLSEGCMQDAKTILALLWLQRRIALRGKP